VTALASCGYTTGLTLGPDYHSVGLEIFGNDTPEPDLELGLHRALTQATRNMLDARLLDPEQSQLVVRGRLIRFQRRAGIRSVKNVWKEGGVMITAEAELVDPRRDVTLVGPVRAQANVGYARTDRKAEPDALERALNNLAERLVLDLFTGPITGTAGTIPEAPTGDQAQGPASR